MKEKFLRALNFIGGGLIGLSFVSYIYSSLNYLKNYSAMDKLIFIYISGPVFFYLTMVLHELGHMIFGYFTGFKLKILSLGFFQITREENDKLKISRSHKIPGVMAFYAPVKINKEDKRLALMFSGGIISHLINIIIILILSLIFPKEKNILLSLGLLNLGFLIVNANPRGITDGNKIREAIKYKDHADIFIESLDLQEQMLFKKNLLDQNFKDLAYEDSTSLASYYINHANKLILEEDYKKAINLLETILNKSEIGYYKTFAKTNLLSIYLDLKDFEKAKSYYQDKNVKNLLKMKEFSLKAIQIKALYFLDKDYKKTKKAIKIFNRLALDPLAYKDQEEKTKEEINKISLELS